MRSRRERTPPERRRRRRLLAKAAKLSHPTLDARLVDFSREGFALETNQGLRHGQRLIFRVASSRSRPGSTRSHSLVGVVRWCRLRATRPLGDGEFEPVFRAGLTLETQNRDPT